MLGSVPVLHYGLVVFDGSVHSCNTQVTVEVQNTIQSSDERQTQCLAEIPRDQSINESPEAGENARIQDDETEVVTTPEG